MRIVLVSLSLVGLLCVMSVPSSGNPQTELPSTQTQLRDELRRLEQVYGADHPKVLAVKARLVEPAETAFKGLVLVRTRTGDNAVTLRDIRVLPLGGRPFLVGSEVKSEYTRSFFPGRQVWVAIEEVTQMVELGEPKAAPK